MKFDRSSFALVLGNLVPMIGVVFLDWQLFPLILLYWLENVIIGVFNALKMLSCTGTEVFPRKIFLTLFFSVHYGMFCFGHGTFVVDLFGGELDSIPTALHVVTQNGLQLAVIALIISHGVSFLQNFVMSGEYKSLSVSEVMFMPYKRIIVLHVFIIFGGMVLQTFGVTQTGLLMLAVIKIMADLVAHKIEHRKKSELENEVHS